MRYGNPWGVTDTEAALMDALCESGTVPLAAEALRISVASARARLRQVSLRMAGHKPHSRLIVPIRGIPTIRACLMWQQWTATHAERSERISRAQAQGSLLPPESPQTEQLSLDA